MITFQYPYIPIYIYPYIQYPKFIERMLFRCFEMKINDKLKGF